MGKVGNITSPAASSACSVVGSITDGPKNRKLVVFC